MLFHTDFDRVKTSRILFVLCWAAYTAAYFGRISYYTSLTDMINSCGFEKPDAGLIGTAFFFCYGCGQMVSGILGDRFSPFKMIMTGLTLSAAANLAISFCRNYIVMSVIWGFNGLAQSLLWSPTLYIIVKYLRPEFRKKACLYMSTSAPVGTVATYLTSMVILKYLHWNVVFLISSVILAASAVIWLCFSLCVSVQPVSCDADIPAQETSKNANPESRNFSALLILSGAAVMLPAILIHGMLKEGVSVWVPTMISETFRVSPSFSVFLATFLPVVSLAGPYAIDPLYRKLLKNNEAAAAAICLISAVPPICVLLMISRLPIAVCVSMLALVTASMNAFNYIAVTMIPVRFTGYNKVSTATGLLNSVTYMGCALSTYGFGLLSEQFGWKDTIAFWVVLAAIGTLICLCAFRRWHAFIHADSRQIAANPDDKAPRNVPVR